MFRLALKFGLHRVSRTDQRRKSRTPCIKKTDLCSVAYLGGGGGARAPPLACEVQNRTFLVLLRPIFCEKLKTAPQRKLGAKVVK